MNLIPDDRNRIKKSRIDSVQLSVLLETTVSNGCRLKNNTEKTDDSSCKTSLLSAFYRSVQTSAPLSLPCLLEGRVIKSGQTDRYFPKCHNNKRSNKQKSVGSLQIATINLSSANKLGGSQRSITMTVASLFSRTMT